MDLYRASAQGLVVLVNYFCRDVLDALERGNSAFELSSPPDDGMRMTKEQPHRVLEPHAIQHLYVRDVLSNLRGAHAELVEAYRAKCPAGWDRGPNDGYFFEHLAYHLREAGRHTEVYDLLTASPDWMNAKFAACIGDASYAADLDQAIADFADPLDADRALVLARLHTARQVVHARVSIYNDTDLKTLVWLGREREALSHARLRSKPEKQFFGLMAIYEAQKQQNRADITLLFSLPPIARAIPVEGGRASALSALAAALAQAGMFDEAGEVAHVILDEWNRASALRASWQQPWPRREMDERRQYSTRRARWRVPFRMKGVRARP